MSKVAKKLESKKAVATTTSKKEFKQAAYEQKYKLRMEQQAQEDAAKKEARAKKAERTNKPGIINTIFNTIVELNGTKISKLELLEVLMYKFGQPNEDGTPSKHTKVTMMKTINAQLGNKFPNRMEREKQVVFDIDYNANGDKEFGYTE